MFFCKTLPLAYYTVVPINIKPVVYNKNQRGTYIIRLAY